MARSASATARLPATPVTCADNLSGSPYASALLGDFTSLSQSSARPIGYFRYTNLEFYGQDTWKMTPRFTLDYGMRFAWYQPQYDERNQLAIFDPASYDPSKAVRLYLPAVGGGAYDPANPGNCGGREPHRYRRPRQWRAFERHAVRFKRLLPGWMEGPRGDGGASPRALPMR